MAYDFQAWMLIWKTTGLYCDDHYAVDHEGNAKKDLPIIENFGLALVNMAIILYNDTKR